MSVHISIFLSSDDNYAPFVTTTIASICYNTKSFIDFYILDGGISVFNKHRIGMLKQQFANFSLEFIKINVAKAFNGFNMTVPHISISTYNRLLIPELNPDIDRALYTDVDVIALGDIAEMYEQSLGEYALGAVTRLYFKKYSTEQRLKNFLPFGKVAVNNLFFQLGMLVSNMLRVDIMNDYKHIINQLCAAFAASSLLIQGAGGNISVKDGDTLRIKASGFRLSEALTKDIFLPVSRSEVLAAVNADRETFSPPSNGMRPSIETPLHALMPQRIVLHLHMIDALIHASLPGPRELLNTLLAGLSWRMLPYARPGLPLSKLVRETLENSDMLPDVLILKNHGIVIAADDEKAAIRKTNELVRRLWLPPRPLFVPNIPALMARNDADLRVPIAPYPHALAFGPVAAALRASNPLCPDQMVFLGPALCTLGPDETVSAALHRFSQTCGYEAPFVVLPECGVLFSPRISAGAEAMVDALAHVALRAPELAVLECLPDACLDELASWEAEQWRQSLDRASGATGTHRVNTA